MCLAPFSLEPRCSPSISNVSGSWPKPLGDERVHLFEVGADVAAVPDGERGEPPEPTHERFEETLDRRGVDESHFDPAPEHRRERTGPLAEGVELPHQIVWQPRLRHLPL